VANGRAAGKWEKGTGNGNGNGKCENIDPGIITPSTIIFPPFSSLLAGKKINYVRAPPPFIMFRCLDLT
jgi:hypothetical protein